jgi:fructose-bisphosphate aldolase class I
MRAMASGAPSRIGTTAEQASLSTPARPSTNEVSMSTTALESAARMLVAPGRGILAADESHSTIEKRFSSTASRTRKRPAGSTGRCSSPPRGGRLGMNPGITVDKGTKPLAGASGDLIRGPGQPRLAEYRGLASTPT